MERVTLVRRTAWRCFGSAWTGLRVCGPMTSSKMSTSPTFRFSARVVFGGSPLWDLGAAAKTTGSDGGAGGGLSIQRSRSVALVLPWDRQQDWSPQV